MNRWKTIVGGAAIASLVIGPGAVAAVATTLQPGVTELTVERIANPIGIDIENPRFGWRLTDDRPGAVQTAYEIEVSESEDITESIWDTGKVESRSTFGIEYDGPTLDSQTGYFWRVRSWDGGGHVSEWSDVASFETAFLDADDFGGEWIGSSHRSPAVALTDTNWIWHAADPDTVPGGERFFRSNLEIPAGTDIAAAQLQITADDFFVLYVNGTRVLASPTSGDAWRVVRVTDIAAYLHEGANTLAVQVANSAGPFGVGGSAGLLARVRVDMADGGSIDVRTDTSWRSSSERATGWEAESFDDADWKPTKIIAAYGSGPWGSNATAATPPEALLRRDFAVEKPIVSAKAYVSGLGYYKLYLNGSRVGDHELDPGFTVYDKTTLYSTYDVTEAIVSGENAIGVSLGRGYFGLMQPDEWTSSSWHDDTKLRLELLIEYADGTSDRVVSDTDWVASDGPTTSESVWFGETYDARLEQPGWNDKGFDSSAWTPAVRVSAPGGALRSQLFPAIKVTDELPVVAITQPSPRTFVYDFGRPTAGWAQVELAGPAGSAVDMKYGERLHPDGTVNNDNVYWTVQNYKYILKGSETETFEPSYSYAGYRYLQVSVPEGVTIGDVIGKRVHTAVQRTGDFSSSSDLVDKYDEAQADTILNNLHSIPTDTPMYEKRAYGADAFLMSDSSIALFDMQNFWGNWLRTHTDDQSPDGTFGNTVPGTVGSKSQTDPVWSSSFVQIAWDAYEKYGDVRALSDNYEGLARWMDHYADVIAATSGIYTGFSYGDWLSPAGANAPEGTRLLATAYLYDGAKKMTQIAEALGEETDAARFESLSAEIYDDFNATFYDASKGAYFDNAAAGYRQTSNVLPLRFGLVPEAAKAKVLENLVADVRDRGDHLNTGAIGTKELLPVLTENGYADLAYAVATNQTYPGWGYWFGELGATTMWEEWNAESRSHNHAFLGTVVDWLYDDVAGIEPTAPGYTGIKIQPYPIAGLDHAQAEIDSPLGAISSSWARSGDAYTLDVSIPVGATAKVYVPVNEGEEVVVAPNTTATSGGRDGGFEVYTVGAGNYRFVASEAEVPADLDIDVTASLRTLGGKAYVSARATNNAAVPVDIVITTPYGSKTFTNVAPGKAAGVSINTREVSVPAGSVTYQITGNVNGAPVTVTKTATY